MQCQTCNRQFQYESAHILERFDVHLCEQCVSQHYSGFTDSIRVLGDQVEPTLHNLIGRGMAAFGYDYPNEPVAYGELAFTPAAASYLKDMWHVDWNTLRTEDIVGLEVVPLDPDCPPGYDVNVALYEYGASSRLRFYNVYVYWPDGRPGMRGAWIDVNSEEDGLVVYPNPSDDIGRPIILKGWHEVLSFVFVNGNYQLRLGRA